MARQPTISTEQRKWRAQDDARTLAEAAVIKVDKVRLTAAVKEAKVMAKDQKEQATALSKVAGYSVRKTGKK